MVLGLSLRVSWICLMLFSSAACYPATKTDYRYPYTATWDSSGRPAPRSKHEAAPQPASSLAGNQSPPSVGAPSVAAGSSPSHEPKKFTETSDSSSNSPTSFRFGDGPVAYAAATPSHSDSDGPPGLPWAMPPVGGADGPPDLPWAVPPVGGADGPPDLPWAVPPVGGADGPPDLPWAVQPEDGADGSPGLPWAAQLVGGPDASFYNPSNWMLFQDSNDNMPESVSETSPLPPSSYIIQSRNGYLRAREVYSNTKYSPEYPVFPFKAARAPSKRQPVTGSKGGQKV